MSEKKFKRCIMRVVVGEEVPAKLAAVLERNGSTSVATISRAIKWLCRQPSDIQAAALGLYPEQIDLSATIVKQLKDR